MGQVEVIGLGGVFPGKSIDLLDARTDTERLALDACGRLGRFSQVADLAIGEPGLPCLDQQLRRAGSAARAAQTTFDFDQMLDFPQEPTIDVGQAMNVLDRASPAKCLGNNVDPLRCRVPKNPVEVFGLQVLAPGRAGRAAGLEHAQRLLKGLFEASADRHHLANRLHGRSDAEGRPMEFLQIPTRRLHHDVIQRRLEASHRRAGDGVGELGEVVAEPELRGHERERITRRLGGESGAPGQPGVDLDYAIGA